MKTMKIQRFLLGSILSLAFLFTSTPQYCPAMESALDVETPSESSRPWFMIWDFFWVLFRVDQTAAEFDIAGPPTPGIPSSPIFRAEATMRANRWGTMDLGVASKEAVAREAQDKGQDYAAVVRYIENIGTWVKPIPLGMELYKRVKVATLATLLLSNLSVYCLSGLQNPRYFSFASHTSCYKNGPNIFADARATARSFPYCEGYSCKMGLGKPDVLCYQVFLLLNCPNVPEETKNECRNIQKQLLKNLRQKFDDEDSLEHAATESLSPRQRTTLQQRVKELDVEITRCRNALEQLIADTRRSSPALDAFAHRCAFVDDSRMNLQGAATAGIYPISCQCHAVAYLTIVKKGIMPRDAEYEELLNRYAPGHLPHFSSWTLEELHNYERIDEDLHGQKKRDAHGLVMLDEHGQPLRDPPILPREDYITWVSLDEVT